MHVLTTSSGIIQVGIVGVPRKNQDSITTHVIVDILPSEHFKNVLVRPSRFTISLAKQQYILVAKARPPELVLYKLDESSLHTLLRQSVDLVRAAYFEPKLDRII